jgi:hypothetical protein
MVLGAALSLTSQGAAQVIPDGRLNNPDPGQAQRDRAAIDGGAVDKPKPEIEIYSGPTDTAPTPGGIVIVPEETAQPSPAVPADRELPPSPPKKENQ